jgi:hypothetical protein
LSVPPQVNVQRRGSSKEDEKPTVEEGNFQFLYVFNGKSETRISTRFLFNFENNARELNKLQKEHI